MKTQITDKEFKFAKTIATFCNIGFIRFAPGTFGSMSAFPVFFLMNYIFLLLGLNSLWQLLTFYLLILAGGFYKGLWATGVYLAKTKKDDPGEVVIDEVIGQLIAYMIPTLLLVYYFYYLINIEIISKISMLVISIILTLLPFLFFRFFDILKPGLVGYFDKEVKGAFGVMMDDVVAGLYAGLVVAIVLSGYLMAIAYFS